jgi:polyisoprenoid-binding protein YceI
VAIQAGTHRLGPDNATLSVHTKRKGAAAKAGHDLVIHVTSWEGTLEVGDDPAATRIALSADATSLRVQKGTGGLQALGDDDKASIHQTIDDEVLKRQDISFRSTAVEPEGDGGRIRVTGDLTLAGTTRPVEFDLVVNDAGKLSGTAVITQSLWGMKPYSALFGALKVADDVEIVLDNHR